MPVVPEKKILLIDNYDSFTYNLQHLLLMFPGVSLQVKRNDDALLRVMEQQHFDGVVIGPGPGSPEDTRYFGDNRQIILRYGTAGLPILGVCLGFQGIYHAFGGKLKVSVCPMHGKTSYLQITDTHSKLLQNIRHAPVVMRYHSIVADLSSAIPDCLRLTAYATALPYNRDVDVQLVDTPPVNLQQQEEQGKELMALEHKHYPIYGVQFHPESFATECGQMIVGNFLNILSVHK